VADRVATLLLDRELARRFGERGRAWVAERWRWDDLAVRLQRLLAGQPVG
jgi:phosphatidylinositol alpha-1,6-mannosyltransferase